MYYICNLKEIVETKPQNEQLLQINVVFDKHGLRFYLKRSGDKFYFSPTRNKKVRNVRSNSKSSSKLGKANHNKQKNPSIHVQ